MLSKGTNVQQKVFTTFCVTFVSDFILTTAVFLLLQVCEWKDPEELAQLLDLELRAAGEPHHRLLERVRDVAKYSIKTSKYAGSHTHTAFIQGTSFLYCFLILRNNIHGKYSAVIVACFQKYAQKTSFRFFSFSKLTLGHPRFFNQQFAGVDYHSLAGRFLSEALNTNV